MGYLVNTTYLIVYLTVLARQLRLPVPAILFLLFGGRWPVSANWAFIQKKESEVISAQATIMS